MPKTYFVQRHPALYIRSICVRRSNLRNLYTPSFQTIRIYEANFNRYLRSNINNYVANTCAQIAQRATDSRWDSIGSPSLPSRISIASFEPIPRYGNRFKRNQGNADLLYLSGT